MKLVPELSCLWNRKRKMLEGWEMLRGWWWGESHSPTQPLFWNIFPALCIVPRHRPEGLEHQENRVICVAVKGELFECADLGSDPRSTRCVIIALSTLCFSNDKTQ